MYEFQCRLRFTSCILDQCAVDGAAVSGGVCGVARRGVKACPSPKESSLPPIGFLREYFYLDT